MRAYRVITYLTITGLTRFVDLGDQSYGEWIVYKEMKPKYHVESFGGEPSNVMVDQLLRSKRESIQSLIEKISEAQKVKLSFGRRPFIEIVRKSELVELELNPLPESGLNNLHNEALRRKIRIGKS